MLTIYDINIFIDEMNQMTILNAGNNIKDALLEYYKYDQRRSYIIRNYVNETTTFYILVKNKNELEKIFLFFESILLENTHRIKLRTCQLSNDDICDVFELYSNNKFINQVLINLDDRTEFISYDKFRDITDTINNFKKTIPTNASQLEIITYVYDFVKRREYKNVPGDERSYLSRNLSSVLLDKYIVCVGFTKIFNTLLSEYNIPCIEYDFMYKGINQGHEVSIVNVQDNKYNVHGLYFFDPTGDSYTKCQDDETKYKYFLQTYDAYKNIDIDNDSFSRLLEYNEEELKKMINIMKEKKFMKANILEDKKYENTLNIAIDLLNIDDRLFKQSFQNLCTTKDAMQEKIHIYEFILFIKTNFGKEIDQDTFINLLINTHQNNNLNKFLVKSTISKFDYIEDPSKCIIKRP